MMTTASHDVTQLLIAWGHGDEAAGNQLIPLVYGQLRRIARNRLRGEFVSQTLQSTDLINEAHLIVCRNVVIYFEREAQDALFAEFHRALAPGGFLVLGKVETLLGEARGLFSPVNARERIFRKI